MEIHIGDRVADVTLVSKEGNKVQFMIDGKPYDVDIVMAENGSSPILHDGHLSHAQLNGIERIAIVKDGKAYVLGNND